MKRQLQLRQIEAFKALIEQGTVSRAAEVLHVTQPAVSKLLVHLEEETGLQLFERVKGRLTATAQGMRLYGEVDRVFAGLRQIEEAIAIIQRKEMSHFAIGVLPELSGSFIRRATMMFLSRCPDVRPTIHMRASNIVSDRVATRQMDVGFTTSLMSSPNSVVTPIMESPLVCIMPKGHPLSRREFVSPEHVEGIPFIGYAADNRTTNAFNDAIRAYGVDLNVVLESETTPTLCEFVSAGLGISLVHPLSVIDMQGRLDIRRFKPDIPEYFHFCHARSAKNIELVQEYERCAKKIAEEAWAEIFGESAAKQS
ncbi:LysR substrate-binding domain-containing protein [Paraburkholderia sp. MM5477-R1]|uniref:LysR substrate-binding domain-containing protein n=1 Tax=Paraburkholderia sp. MM5477-R1 TaxID=2991062 RepID=UPI003D1B9F30